MFVGIASHSEISSCSWSCSLPNVHLCLVVCPGLNWSHQRFPGSVIKCALFPFLVPLHLLFLQKPASGRSSHPPTPTILAALINVNGQSNRNWLYKRMDVFIHRSVKPCIQKTFFFFFFRWVYPLFYDIIHRNSAFILMNYSVSRYAFTL